MFRKRLFLGGSRKSTATRSSVKNRSKTSSKSKSSIESVAVGQKGLFHLVESKLTEVVTAAQPMVCTTGRRDIVEPTIGMNQRFSYSMGTGNLAHTSDHESTVSETLNSSKSAFGTVTKQQEFIKPDKQPTPRSSTERSPYDDLLQAYSSFDLTPDEIKAMYKIENGDIKSTANRIERAQTILNMKWPKHEGTGQNEGDSSQMTRPKPDVKWLINAFSSSAFPPYRIEAVFEIENRNMARTADRLLTMQRLEKNVE